MNQQLEKVAKCIQISRRPKPHKNVMTSKGSIEDQDHEKGLKKNNNKASQNTSALPIDKMLYMCIYVYIQIHILLCDLFVCVYVYVHICVLHV